MVKKLLTLFMLGATALSANAQYQLANSDFEEWESVTYSGRTGDEPVNWSSFLDGTGNLKSMAGYSQLEKSTDKPTSSAGSYSAKLTSRAVKAGVITLAVAQGNLTNGCVNMGSMTATDASGNYNYINLSRTDQSMGFTGLPDAVKVWVKFSGTKTGNVEVILVGDMEEKTFQSPESSKAPNTAVLVAKAQNDQIPSNNTWTEYTIPFTYFSEEDPNFSLVNISTCATPGAGKATDYMYVDDMVMLYYSELETATYDGATIEFEGTSASVDAVYDDAKLELTSNGRAATIEKAYDSKTAILTITVKGQTINVDPENKHVYTIQFAKDDAPAGPAVVSSKVYTAPLYVIINGEFTAPQDADVIVETLDNGNINFILKNFVLGTGDDAIPVGNIAVKNLEVTADDAFSFNDILNIEAGDAEGVEFWLGPVLGEIPLAMDGKFADDKVYVDIDIDMMSSIGQIIKVHLGDDYVPATLAVNAEAKYGTFCAPFDVAVPDGVEASTASLNGQMIELTSIGETIPANTPVVLNAEDGLEAKTVYGKAVAGSTSSGCLTGVLVATTISQGYVLQNHSGKVGFYELTSSKEIPANRAYLTAPAGARFFGFDDETSISSINVNANANTAIYNLAGQRVSKAEKGIFIINGKKVVK